jgi:hypothetical protein
MAIPAIRSTLLPLLLSAALVALAQAKPLSMFGYDGQHMRHQTSMDFYAPSDRGCALCRNGENCSLAVHNQSAGVFCGDVLSTFQPCCCSFRNECMTTIFSDNCECFDGVREEQVMTTRFYLFVGLSLIAWVLLAYDKMCAGPYKVMNSNHQLLSSSPSAARARGEDSVVDTVDSDSEDEARTTERGVDTTTTAAVATAAVEVEEEAQMDDDTAPLRPQSSSPSEGATEAEDADHSAEEAQTDDHRRERSGSSIQAV